MLIITDLKDVPLGFPPCALTIGSFDGVHMGHQALLDELKRCVGPGAPIVVFTFSNHPSHHLTPDRAVPLICSPQHKAKLLGQYGADLVILIPFTAEFAECLFDQFLQLLKDKLSFTHLVLGTGATFGKGREGNESNVRALADELRFHVEYLPKFNLHGSPISSGRIRTLINQGEFTKVEECLGRPYSLLGRLGNAEGGHYVMESKGLCLPPDGNYPVHLKVGVEELPAKAVVDSVEHKIYIEPAEGEILPAGNEVEIVFL
jgi:riboflavin kinase / FMN adenylyltransferase